MEGEGVNGRERVIASVRRCPADRIAVGAMGIDDGVSLRIRHLLGASPDSDLDQLLGLDMLDLMPEYVGPEFSWKPENRRRSFFGSSDKTYSAAVAERPLRDAETVAEVDEFRWPTADDYSFSRIAGEHGRGSEQALCGPGWTPTFSQLCELFGMESALSNLLLRPALIEAAIERITDLVCGLIRRLHAATNGHLLVAKTSDDLATQRGLMFRPDLWRRLFRSAMERQFLVAKELGLLVMLHSCGDLSAILPDLVDMGLDILEPTQAHLPGMAPEMLKREYGAHLTFFGAISTQTTLPHGTPDEVRGEVLQRIDVLGRGGGYIVSPDHAILPGVPPENVVALYRAAGSLD
jgi:uroporphyrinogen decarboxylase